MENNDKRIAVLIDADNVSGKYIQPILNEISNYGTPTYKRIYGDWTKPQLSSWKEGLLNYSITPIQQYSYTVGKNSTDAALIIDAMDILYSGNVDGFCIVSSDSDFTRLASRLREAGMYVIGMGEQKTPAPFKAAVEKFIYLEVLASGEDEKENGGAEKPDTAKSSSKSNVMSSRRLVNVIKAIINELSDDEGWAHLSAVGNVLNRRHPDFDTRNYGYAKMSTLIKSLKQFEVQSRKTENSHQNPVYVRAK